MWYVDAFPSASNVAEWWNARVGGYGIDGFIERCCVRSPVQLLFTVPYTMCVSSQKLNFENKPTLMVQIQNVIKIY